MTENHEEHTTGCRRCRAVELLGPPPYTPAQFVQLGVVESSPTPEREALRTDPEVVAATGSVALARAAFDQVNRTWEDASIAMSRAELTAYAEAAHTYATRPNAAGDMSHVPPDLREKRRAEAARDAAQKERLLAWKAVVKANDRLIAAQARARQRVNVVAHHG